MRLHEVCLVLLFGLVRPSYEQFDPLRNFCRRWGHQTAVIDNKLYIDGGLVDYGTSVSPTTTNYSNDRLLYNDLGVITDTFPTQFGNLTKPATVPSVNGGTLWADTVNKIWYLYGGQYNTAPPDTFTLWAYDTLYNTWNSSSATSSDGSQVNRVSYGAAAVDDSRGIGYYFGGWLSNASVSGFGTRSLMTSNLLAYDMNSSTFTNGSGPSTTDAFAEGVMSFIPASDGGMLVYFGGIKQPVGGGNGSWTALSMDQIYLFDLANAKWYVQQATGRVPESRRRFCGGATWAQDQSSYNYYLYGGLPAVDQGYGFDDVYILSIPSFTWIKWYPDDNSTGYPHHSLSCNVLSGSQMSIMGGYFTNSSFTDCDVPKIWGQHNLNLGEQDVANAEWYQYLRNVTSYQVPATIISAVGGGPTGGATVTEPAQGWANPDLGTYFTRRYSPTPRTATRSIPTTAASAPTSAKPTQTAAPHHTNVGAIAGGAVGGVVALVGTIVLAWYCLRRRKRAKQDFNAAPLNPSAPMSEQYQASPRSDYTGGHKPQISLSGTQGSPSHSPQGSPPPQFSPGHWNRTSPVQQQYSPHVQHQYYPSPQQQYFPPPPAPQTYETPMPTFEMPSVRSPINIAEPHPKPLNFNPPPNA